MKFDYLYPKSYYKTRFQNDDLRVQTFLSESDFVRSLCPTGSILDVGCSTGEFLEAIQWDGARFGMEVSEYAIEIAKTNGVNFEKDLFSETDYFDLIIFRGTIQHLDRPFEYMQACQKALKPGGFVFFLATPNANSIFYKIWNTLPFLDSERNFFIPSDIVLCDTMRNFGFSRVAIEYPYLSSVYSSPARDHLKFLAKIIGFNVNFPFWKSMMNVAFQKK